MKEMEMHFFDDFTYTLRKDGTALICGYKGSAAELILPRELDGYRVSGIREETFWGNHSLIKIILP